MRLSDCSVEAVLFPKPSAPSAPLAVLSSHLGPCLLSFMPLLSSSTDAALGRRTIWSDSSESQTKMIRGNIKNSDCFPQIKDIFLPFGQLYLPHSRLPRLRRLRCPYPHLFLFLSLSLSLYLLLHKSKVKATDFRWGMELWERMQFFNLFFLPFP